MRRFVIATGIACLLLSSLAGGAQAGRKAKPRTAKVEYTNPNAVSTGPGTLSFYSEWTGNLKVIKTKRTEDTMSISVEDAAGGTVAGAVYQGGSVVDRFCGPKDDIQLPGGKEVIIEIYAGLCQGENKASVVTQGTITATFKDLR